MLGYENDATQICQAVQGGWEFFITTDFRTILVHQRSLEKFRIKARSPLQFLEENLLPLPVLIKTLYGSWTDPDKFIEQTGEALQALLRS